jgi:signal transduction histidine kinase/DNA-binding NarL/FixJ family response regulator
VRTVSSRATVSRAKRATTLEPENELQALSAGALHMTVYELLAHAYNRVATRYYHDQGPELLMELRRYPPTLYAPALPPTLSREVVAALLADAARALATFFGFAEMNFILLDHEQKLYRLAVREGMRFPHFEAGVYTQPFGVGLLGQCHRERSTVLVNDVSASPDYISNDPAVRAELCVPVVLDDEVLAIIDSGAYTVNAFTTAHTAFIEGFARYLAPAIADPLSFLQAWRPELLPDTSAFAPLAQSLNFLYSWHEEWRTRFSQIYTEAARRNVELMALAELSATLGASLRLDTVLETTVAKVAELTGCQMAWILLPDEDGRLRMRALHGGSLAGFASAQMVSEESPQSRVYTKGIPLITNDIASLSRASFDWTFLRHNQVARFATAPLRAHEATIGVMTIARTRSSEELTTHDLRVLTTFTSQIALAIENAALYEQSRLRGAAEERARLARDLHDTLAQSMLTILRTLEALDSEPGALPEPLRERLAQARIMARQSLDEARRSVWNLQPAALEHASLREALDSLMSDWNARGGAHARFEQKGRVTPLAPRVESELLLITREALSNIARHAAASSVTVTLQYGVAGLRLLISDDGAGFNPESRQETGDGARGDDLRQTSVAGGLGLRGMRQRARLLGATLSVESAPGWGTRLALTLPRAALDPSRSAYTAAAPADFTSVAPAADAEMTIPSEAAFVSDVVDVADAAMGAEAPRPAIVAPEAGRAITVLLVDDHPALREGMRKTLSAERDLQVIGVAATAAEALSLTRRQAPDVLLLDMRLPDSGGLEVIRQLRGEAISTQIVVFSALSDDAQIIAAIQAGVAGYLNKDVPIAELLAAIRAAAAGRSVYSPDIAERLRGREGLLVNTRANQLTPREREALDLLASGMRTRVIAQRMGVAEATAKFHIANLYQKLQSTSRVDALNRAREWGLLR